MREDLIGLIKEINNEFDGQLINEDIEFYLDKLLKNAEIMLHYSNNVMVGCLAFYANDHLNKKAFISFIGIKNTHRDKGLGKILLNSSMAYLKKNNFNEYGLEVIKNNENAINFYMKQDFIKKEDRTDRIFMVKKI